MLKVDCNSLRDIRSCSDHVQLRVVLGSGEEIFFQGPSPARADQLHILTLNWKDLLSVAR